MIRPLLVTFAILAAVAPASTARADGTAEGMDPADMHFDGIPDGTRGSEFMNQMGEMGSRLGDAAGQLSSAAGLMSDLFGAYNALSDLDRALQSHLQDDHSGPEVPTSCGSAAATATCAECYAAAYREVNFTRNTLERLRTIDERTLAFIKAAVSVGDTTSGIHGVTGLSWQYARADVESAKRDFLRTSRAKYDGLVQNMRRALDMVAKCEADNFHNPDWYNRYGFMYFNFIKEAYAIHDQ